MKKILVVVDMQNDFVDGALGTQEAMDIVSKVEKKIKEFQGEIFYTQDTHGTNYLQTQEGENLPVTHCVKNTIGWQLYPSILHLCVQKHSDVVEKVTFGSKKLPVLLKTKYPQGLDEIELVGLCTDICVISNAMILKAWFPETKITVDGSCCAGVTPATHNNALEAMKICQIQII